MGRKRTVGSVDRHQPDSAVMLITAAESLDIWAYAIKRLGNHKMSGDVTAGYIVSDVERLRAPMQRIADYLLSERAGETRGEVVALGRQRVSA